MIWLISSVAGAADSVATVVVSLITISLDDTGFTATRPNAHYNEFA